MMYGLPKFGDGIALARILAFYQALGIDTDRLAKRSIVVTGSNGKGSTARFIAGALESKGLRVGCFTSPHLFDVRERFLIGEEQIPRAMFDAHARTVLDYNATLPEGDRMGAFEFLFLLAILWFEREAPGAIVWEAGIGGRYDPVRTVRARVSCLTSIEREHTELLGATEELIAYDKTDALAPGGTLILSPGIPGDLCRRIDAYARLTGRTAAPAGQRAQGIENTADGVRFIWRPAGGERDLRVQLRLIGRHQADNAVTALAAARAWLGEDIATPPSSDMLDAIGEVRWAGRLEHVASSPDLWIDVGHTPHALDLVTEAFGDIAPRETTLVVFGVSASKEVARIAATVAGRFDHFILTHAHKSAAEIGSFRGAFTGKDAVAEPDIAVAVRLAKERAAREGLTVLALGGLFLAVETQCAWVGRDPKELEFF